MRLYPNKRRLKLTTNPADTDKGTYRAVTHGGPNATGQSSQEETRPGTQDQHADHGLVITVFDLVKPLVNFRHENGRA
jgi:hypothetical protein